MPAPSIAGSRRVRSADGAVVFTLVPTARGVAVERVLVHGGNVVSQVVAFADAESFHRWCDANPMRFENPSIHVEVTRDGDAIILRQGVQDRLAR
ncbi:hypothetical protein [Methylibium rhizosphaerae]|uniref:hypothetical protein n=1 Tax=Methylibium rhizosphaerae TaxID=2570323 RepID=UPI0015E464E5|nr:hypothetical protein [Methylibium rhizosphaerae]